MDERDEQMMHDQDPMEQSIPQEEESIPRPDELREEIKVIPIDCVHESGECPAWNGVCPEGLVVYVESRSRRDQLALLGRLYEERRSDEDPDHYEAHRITDEIARLQEGQPQ